MSHVLQYALPHLRKAQGNIINDSSIVALLGQVGAVPYVTTKVSQGHMLSERLVKS